MKLGKIALKIRVANTDFGNYVAGSAELDMALSGTLLRESAFVIPLIESAEENVHDSAIMQQLVERFGIVIQGSPRHADILVVTGPVTRQVKDRLVRIYEQMPEPKSVIALGTCAISGAPFIDCYNVYGGVDHVVPVNAYVPGCPPKPEAIIDGVIKLIPKLRI